MQKSLEIIFPRLFLLWCNYFCEEIAARGADVQDEFRMNRDLLKWVKCHAYLFQEFLFLVPRVRCCGLAELPNASDLFLLKSIREIFDVGKPSFNI